MARSQQEPQTKGVVIEPKAQWLYFVLLILTPLRFRVTLPVWVGAPLCRDEEVEPLRSLCKGKWGRESVSLAVV